MERNSSCRRSHDKSDCGADVHGGLGNGSTKEDRAARRVELSEQTREVVNDYLKAANKRPGEFLFTGRCGPGNSITIRQYARLGVDRASGWTRNLFGTHSLRRTKATLIYRRTGNLGAVRLLLGHTKFESTVRYLGIEVDDALGHSGTS